MNWNSHRASNHGGSAPATLGFNAVAPEWLINYGAADAAPVIPAARTLPIYGDMRRWLERQRETCPEGCTWVFHGAHSHPVDSHMNGWVDACRRAGLSGLLFHDLRRSAVRNMKKAGLQDLEAMRISGHLTRNVFDRYNIIDEDDLADAGKRLEEYAAKRKLERAAKLRLVK